MSAWKASIADLKALTEFLEGLTELSNRTGVMACAYTHTDVEIGETSLQVNSARDGDGRISYFIDEFE